MTDGGLPTVEGALACPFVAFDDDRDARATSPDHRHRCYAEVRPAPRALAHQQAYCLSSAFAVCPTFQDWARREAAQARSASDASAIAAPLDPEASSEMVDSDWLASESGSQRNPRRDWASPPPWAGSQSSSSSDRDPEDDEEPPEVEVIPPRGGGLAGSFADRLASGPTSSPDAAAPAWIAPAGRESDTSHGLPAAERRDDELEVAAATGRSLRPSARRAGAEDGGPSTRIAPSWERPPRREAYPTLKTRMGLSGISLPPILLGVVAVLIAGLALFFLPAILGIGNPQATPGPSPTAGGSGIAASPTPGEPTVAPAPTEQVYIVQAGDTMSKIANRFGVPLQVLIDANKVTIPNPDKVTIGQQVVIPATAPTLVPDAGGSPIPAGSTSP